MPITLSQIAANTAATEFVYAGETVHLVYRPDNLTDHTMNAAAIVLADPLNLATNKDAINAIILDLLKSWDVLNNDESPYPIDQEHLAALPIDFRMHVIIAITNHMRPKAEETPTGT